MEWTNCFKSILKGVVWALGITIISTIIFSITMNTVDIGEKVFNVIDSSI